MTLPRFEFLMIVEDGEVARFAAANGVDRLFVDLEVLGKAQRQGHLDTVQSRQTPATLSLVRDAAPDAHVMVRINPLHEGSAAEIDDVVARGADSVMLPMFRDTDTLARFTDLLAGRAGSIPLFEAQGAVDALPEILARGIPFDRAHFGLNDLHLDRGERFILEPLLRNALDIAARALRSSSRPFGIGGLARAGEGDVPPELLLAEHVRLGSTGAILSRTFHRNAKSVAEIRESMDFAAETERLRALHASLIALGDTALQRRVAKAREAMEGAIARRAVERDPT